MIFRALPLRRGKRRGKRAKSSSIGNSTDLRLAAAVSVPDRRSRVLQVRLETLRSQVVFFLWDFLVDKMIKVVM